MTEKLRNTVSWTVFIIISIVVVLGLIVPFFMTIFFPVFWPNIDVTTMGAWVQKSSSIIGLFSMGLGVLSIWQAKESNIESREMLKLITDIRRNQEFEANYRQNRQYHYYDSSSAQKQWKHDDVIE